MRLIRSDVRFTPENGLEADITACPKSAKTGSQDQSSFDQLVGLNLH
jgi:hypothetical protein